jgi:hypothetical protein
MKTKAALLMISASILLATTASAFADPAPWARGYRGHEEARFDRDHDRDHRARFVPNYPASYVRGPAYVTRPVYVAQPVYAAPPVAYAPAPYYGASYTARVDDANVVGAVAGAAAGAIIGNAVGQGGDRGATTAIGALVGAAIGANVR